MMKRVFCLLLALCLLLGTAPQALAAELPTYSQVYDSIIAMKGKYPEGAPWTDENSYTWNATGGTGYGCLGFAYMLSDAAFGNLPARKLTEITIEDVRPGDILRIKNNSHSVVVLEVHDSYVIIAEGNYLGTVHWGGKLTAEEVAAADYMSTRYPQDYPKGVTLTGWRKAYYELIQDSIKTSEEGTWEMSSYTLIQPKGEAYPALWVNHVIYASGCTFATIGSQGLSSQLMQQGGLSYIENENLLRYFWGKEGFYDVSIFSVEDGKRVSKASGSYNPVTNVCTWNGTKTTEAEMDAAIDKLMPPSKVVHAHNNAYGYQEFIDLLYQLEAENGPEAAIPEKSVFTDVVAGSFYEKAVAWAVKNSITSGRTATTFAPNDPCKRSEVVTFLHRAQGKPVPGSAQSEFTDVQIGKFYTDAVAWAVENKITSGMGGGIFGVDKYCTRGQVVTFLWRTAGCPVPKSTGCPFPDVTNDDYYYEAVLWAVENGITSGMTDGTFAPEATCTRAQIVTFLHRFAG